MPATLKIMSEITCGEIVLAATPIGNVQDASTHLLNLLTSADVIAAEDTRRLLDLAKRLNVTLKAPILAFHEHNEAEMAPKIVGLAQNGQQVLAVSDAGMPSISDPGYRLVNAAVAAEVPVRVVPGPSAVLTALAVSGLASDRFCFEGFLPRRTGEQQSYLNKLANETRTLIFFESPRRLAASLHSLQAAFGADRRAAVCRELTKTHEEIKRASLGELSLWASENEMRGEIVLVVAGQNKQAELQSSHVDEVLALKDNGLRLKAAAATVAQKYGLRARQLYQAALDRQ